MGNRTSTVSRLPFWKLGDSYETPFGPKNKDTNVIELICPRSWCQGVIVVERKKWWSKNIWETKKADGKIPGIVDNKIRTRACPYCNNMSRIPRRPKTL